MDGTINRSLKPARLLSKQRERSPDGRDGREGDVASLGDDGYTSSRRVSNCDSNIDKFIIRRLAKLEDGFASCGYQAFSCSSKKTFKEAVKT